MKLYPDTHWQDFRTPDYTSLLHATAWTWIKIIQAFTSPPPPLANTPAISSTYYRATLALPQLPSEGTNNSRRFNNSRWRHANVSTPIHPHPHCEHPWSKRITKDIVLNATSLALSRGANPEDLILPISAIIDSRQDTLLLPSQDTSSHKVIPNSQGDGLASRYASPIDLGLIIDRATGKPISPSDASQIELKPATALNSLATLLNVPPASLLLHHKTPNRRT
jgi:hypothetical protein